VVVMHETYRACLDALCTALAGIGLSDAVEVEGPNRLGGFRLTDGRNRVALSHVPSRKNDGKDWWVSGWFPADDALVAPAFLPAASVAEDLQSPRSQWREVVLPRAMERDEAVIAAVQFLVEQRVRGAWRRVAAERDAALAQMMADAISAVAHDSRPHPPAVRSGVRAPEPAPASGGASFGTARGAARSLNGHANGNGRAAVLTRDLTSELDAE